VWLPIRLIVYLPMKRNYEFSSRNITKLFRNITECCSHSYTECMKYSQILFSCSYKLAQQKLEGVQNLQLAFQLEHLGAVGIASMHKKLSGGQVLGPMQNRFEYVHRMATILNAGQATCYVNQTKFSENTKTLFYGFAYLLMRNPLLYSKSRSESDSSPDSGPKAGSGSRK